MSVKSVCDTILNSVGGSENILDFSNCYTRLRFKLHNPGLLDEKKLKTLEKVIGVLHIDGGVHVVMEDGVKKYAAEIFRNI